MPNEVLKGIAELRIMTARAKTGTGTVVEVIYELRLGDLAALWQSVDDSESENAQDEE